MLDTTHTYTHTCLFKPNFLVTVCETKKCSYYPHYHNTKFESFAKNFVRSDLKTFLGQF